MLLSGIAIIFLTLLGAASEKVDFGKYIKSNTTKKRTHSLFTQGRLILKLEPNLKEKWASLISNSFQELCDGLNFITNEPYFI